MTTYGSTMPISIEMSFFSEQQKKTISRIESYMWLLQEVEKIVDLPEKIKLFLEFESKEVLHQFNKSIIPTSENLLCHLIMEYGKLYGESQGRVQLNNEKSKIHSEGMDLDNHNFTYEILRHTVFAHTLTTKDKPQFSMPIGDQLPGMSKLSSQHTNICKNINLQAISDCIGRTKNYISSKLNENINLFYSALNDDEKNKLQEIANTNPSKYYRRPYSPLSGNTENQKLKDKKFELQTVYTEQSGISYKLSTKLSFN